METTAETEAESEIEITAESETESELESEWAVEEVLPEALEPEMETLEEIELDAVLEEAEGQDTYDEESGLTLHGVLLWAAEEEGIDLLGMEDGENVSVFAGKCTLSFLCHRKIPQFAMTLEVWSSLCLTHSQ